MGRALRPRRLSRRSSSRLTGELGAGKTTLVQAICRGYGVTDDVTSPTFALVHRYAAPRVAGLSSRPVPARAARGADEHRLGRDPRGGSARVDRVAGARGRSHCRASHVPIGLQHLPDDPSRGCSTRAATHDHARARRVDLRRRRRAARRRTVLAEQAAAMKGARERTADAGRRRCAASARSVDVGDIDRVVCGAGPGSFTSLRIAGGIAKGIASGSVCPLFAVPSLALVVAGARPAPGRYLVAIDALRGEFYVGLYEVDDDRLHRRDRAGASRCRGRRRRRRGASIGAQHRQPDGRSRAESARRPRARGVARLEELLASAGPSTSRSWEPAYGRLAEAQVKWESAHGRPLPDWMSALDRHGEARGRRGDRGDRARGVQRSVVGAARFARRLSHPSVYFARARA